MDTNNQESGTSMRDVLVERAYRRGSLSQRALRLGSWGVTGYPLEVAAAQICKEAGTRVSTNVHVRVMDLTAFNVFAEDSSSWQMGGPCSEERSSSPLTPLVSPSHREWHRQDEGCRCRRCGVGTCTAPLIFEQIRFCFSRHFGLFWPKPFFWFSIFVVENRPKLCPL